VLNVLRRISDDDNMTVVSAITIDHKLLTGSDRKLLGRKKRSKWGGADDDGDVDDNGDDDDDDDDIEDGYSQGDNIDRSSSSNDDPHKTPGRKKLEAVVAGAAAAAAAAVRHSKSQRGGFHQRSLEVAMERPHHNLEVAMERPPPRGPPPPPPTSGLTAAGATPADSTTVRPSWMPQPLYSTVIPVRDGRAGGGEGGRGGDRDGGKEHTHVRIATTQSARAEVSESTLDEAEDSRSLRAQANALVVGGIGTGILSGSTEDADEAEEEKVEIEPYQWHSSRGRGGTYYLDSQGHIEPVTPTSDRASVSVGGGGAAEVTPVTSVKPVAAGSISRPTSSSHESNGLTEIHVDPSSLPDDDDDADDNNEDAGGYIFSSSEVAAAGTPRASRSNSTSPKSTPTKSRSPVPTAFQVQVPSYGKTTVRNSSVPRHSPPSGHKVDGSVDAHKKASPTEHDDVPVAPTSGSADAVAPVNLPRMGSQSTLSQQQLRWVAKAGGTILAPSPAGTTKASKMWPSGPSGEGNTASAARTPLQRLQRGDMSGSDKVAALNELSELIWRVGAEARAEVVRQGGLAVVPQILWSQDRKKEGSAVVQAALALLWALAASETGDPSLDVVCGADGDGCVDALLIAMQFWSENARVQELGCHVLACLACAASNNARVNDGCEAGSISTVLQAMASHPSDLKVQESCVRALYNQCSTSSNAERNALTLLTCVLEESRSAAEIMAAILHRLIALGEALLVERLCQLYWCLSSSEDSLDLLTSETVPLMVKSVRQFGAWTSHSVALCEAALGTIANVIHSPASRDHSLDVLKLALSLLEPFNSCRRVLTEVFDALSSALVYVPDVNSLLEPGAVTLIVEALKANPENMDLQEQALRALVVLSDTSPVARSTLMGRSICSQLLEHSQGTRRPPSCQALVCRLTSSLLVKVVSPPQEFVNLVLETASLAMSSFVDSIEVQASACTTLSIISNEFRDVVVPIEIITLIETAMENFPSSESIQHDSCCVLRQCLSNSLAAADGDTCIRLIVEALRRHLGSTRLIDVACSTLWSLVHGSDAMKHALIETEGAVDAITCVLVMYPNCERLLEVAIGLLACLSTRSDLMNDLETPERIEAVVDSMRNHRASVHILESCILFLRNTVCVLPQLANDANRALSVTIGALKEGLGGDDSDFKRHACCFLWIMSAASASSKALILELDGVSVLMETLEKYSAVKGVQDAALGAFNELALMSQ
jgi:hypothetical protein